MIGLGRIGANMVRRLLKAGHDCVVYDVHGQAVQTLAGEGAAGAASLPVFREGVHASTRGLAGGPRGGGGPDAPGSGPIARAGRRGAGNKALAGRIAPELEKREEPPRAHDSSTNALIRRYRRLRAPQR